MLRRVVPSRRSLKAFAVAGAWFFIVVSLGHLVWAVGHKWSDPAGTFKLYHTIVDCQSYDAWGLTYGGTLGLLTVVGQALLVSAAAVASVLPWPRTMKLRRMGHGVLCAWAALWALNFIWLASVDHLARVGRSSACFNRPGDPSVLAPWLHRLQSNHGLVAWAFNDAARNADWYYADGCVLAAEGRRRPGP
jgi:hypothetical protein